MHWLVFFIPENQRMASRKAGFAAPAWVMYNVCFCEGGGAPTWATKLCAGMPFKASSLEDGTATAEVVVGFFPASLLAPWGMGPPGSISPAARKASCHFGSCATSYRNYCNCLRSTRISLGPLLASHNTSNDSTPQSPKACVMIVA